MNDGPGSVVPLDREVLSAQVKDRILQWIMTGELAPGDRIVETRTARALGVSQAPVREALRDLASLGLVEIQPYRGASVRIPSKQELIEAMEVRGELEALAAPLAAERITEAELTELRRLIGEMRACAERGDTHEHALRNTEFHALTMRASGNKTLEWLWQMLDPLARTYVTASVPGTDLVWLGARHEAILDALESRDGERAAAVVREHAREAEDLLAAREDQDQESSGHERNAAAMSEEANIGVVWFNDKSCRDSNVAGGKGASLAHMTDAGLPVPPGFVIPAGALQAALEAWGTADEIRGVLEQIDGDAAVASLADRLQKLVTQQSLEGRAAEQIVAAYEALGDSTVAVRSSAGAEDGDAASYAGQQETYLNVLGADELLRRVVDCWGSFFAERALFYRRLKGSLTDLSMAVVVQRQLDPEKAGVMFTTDPVRRRRDQMMLEAAWGLGEAVVSGLVIPDHYLISRDGDLKRSQVALQKVKIVRRADGGTEEVALSEEQAKTQVLAEAEIRALAKLGLRAEEVFGSAQDIEWAIEGDEVYLLQSRPITTG